MSLPFSKFVSITAGVVKPAFTLEKKHLILGIVSDLIPVNNSIFEVQSSDLVLLSSVFGVNSKEVKALKKYFSFLSKFSTSPDKAIIARWFKEAAKASVFSNKPVASLEKLKAVKGKLSIKICEKTVDLNVDFKNIKSYSDVALLIENEIIKNTAHGEDFTKATVKFSSSVNGFIISSGGVGKVKSISIADGDVALSLGFTASSSFGADAESFSEFSERVFHANTSGFAITTLEDVKTSEIMKSIEFLSTLHDGQTINTKLKLIFNFHDLEIAKETAKKLKEKGYSGYVLTYDPHNEYVNILDASIGAAIDFESPNSSVNFNFQKARGYTAITNFNNVHDFQNGVTDSSFCASLDELKISYVYSVGIGTQTETMYGLGLMAGDFGSEDIQINESWLENQLSLGVMNAFNSLNKIPLQGKDAKRIVGLCLIPAFKAGISNGVIAGGGKLSDSDKLALSQSMGSDAVGAVESNGYYFIVLDPTDSDIKSRRLQVKYAYIAGGVVNKIRISASIYGA